MQFDGGESCNIIGLIAPLDGSQTAEEPVGETTTVLLFGQCNHPSNLVEKVSTN
jgi:hypothetical protein